MAEVNINIKVVGAKVVQRWYRALLADGSIWCETSDLSEVLRRARGHDCVFQSLEVVQIEGAWHDWTPHASR